MHAWRVRFCAGPCRVAESRSGAGDGNRTHVICLGSFCRTQIGSTHSTGNPPTFSTQRLNDSNRWAHYCEMERLARIELASSVWETEVLPLNDSRLRQRGLYRGRRNELRAQGLSSATLEKSGASLARYRMGHVGNFVLGNLAIAWHHRVKL